MSESNQGARGKGAMPEPTTLASIDRSYGRERISFEQHTWDGRIVFWLRLRHLTQRGEWSWTPARPSSAGNYWASMNIKGRELRALGEAMIKAADALEQGDGAQLPAEQRSKPARKLPAREARELSKLDDHPICKSSKDGYPF